MIPLKKLTDIAAAKPNVTAVVQGDTEVTWSELLQLVTNAVHNLVHDYEAHKFHRTAYMSEQNSLALVVLMSSFSTLKVPFSGLDFTNGLEAKLHCVQQMEADCLFYTRQFADEAQAIADRLSIKTLCIEDVYGNLVSKAAQPLDFDLFAINRPFESLSFTSGTSGLPKVVFRNTPFEARRFAYLTERYGFTPEDRFLVSLPFYHVSSSGWARLFLDLGGSIVLGDFYQPTALATDMIRHNVTTSLIVPPTLQQLTRVFENEEVAGKPALKFIMVGGKNFPQDLKAAATRVFGPILHEYYGSTESGVNTLADPYEIENYPKSVGTVMDGSKIVIVDENMQLLPTGVKGRIAIYSYQSMAGYLNKESETLVIDGETYLLMPDYGWFDNGGRLYVASRSNSEIDIYSIENQLRGLPGVNDSYVLLDDSKIASCALAMANEEDVALIEADIKRIFAAHSIEQYKLLVLPEIMYSMSGKVKQKEFQALIAESSPVRI